MSESAESSEALSKTGRQSRPDSGILSDTMTQRVRPPAEVNIDELSAKRLLKISCHKCLQKLDVTFLAPFSRFECPSCQMELIVPEWFDNYLLEEPGGIGGMATVYRALDLALDREVAIKVLKPELASDAARAELFLHEARTAATINHYAVIPIYTCGVFEERPYIVMQYMGGGSLEAKLKLARGVLPVADVARWIRDAAEGLDNARRHGITHHDVKPGNIMLDADGNAKIGDFGLAYAVNDARSFKLAELTKSWLSPNYVSPERVQNGKEDYLGDIYSLGASFYHLVTGFTPFNNPNVEELLKLRLNTDPVPPHQQRPELPLPLSHLILSMMDRSPDKRPSYREIAANLSDYLKSLSPKSRASRAEAAKSQAEEEDLEREEREEPSRKKKGLGLPLISTLILAVVALGLAVYGVSAGKLQSALGGGPKKQAIQLNLDALSPISLPAALASGDAQVALKTADELFSDISAPPATRVQAAVVLAIANYLADAQKAKENCAFIGERLEAILAAADPVNEILLKARPGKKLVAYLADDANDDETLQSELADNAPQALKVAANLVRFLRSARNNAQSELLMANFASLKEEASKDANSSWCRLWAARCEAWSPALDPKHAGHADPRLEPLIARLSNELSNAAAGDAQAKAEPAKKQQERKQKKHKDAN